MRKDARVWFTAVFLAATALTLFGASAALGFGELAQKPGPAGCISNDGSGGRCQTGVEFSALAGLVVSRDGKNAYAASANRNAVLIFDRDPATGTLSQKPGMAGCIGSSPPCQASVTRVLVTPLRLAESPAGENLYAITANSNSLIAFARDKATGTLSEVGCVSQDSGVKTCAASRGMTRPAAVAVSPDGANVYVTSAASGSVAVFDREPNGMPAQKPGKDGCISQSGADGCETGRALSAAGGMAISPDGSSLYVSTSKPGAVAILARGAGGVLSQKAGAAGCVSASGAEGCGGDPLLEEIGPLVISPDGRNLYAGFRKEGVAVLDRDPAGGGLTQKGGKDGCLSNDGSGGTCRRGIALAAPARIAISPDGESAYVSTSADTIAILGRDPGSGVLSQKRTRAACLGGPGTTCNQADLIDEPGEIAVSADGKDVYVVDSGFGLSAILGFDRSLIHQPPDKTAPRVSGFKLAPARLRARSKHGGSIRFSLSEPASVRIVIERPRPRRRPHRGSKARGHKASQRFARVGALRFPVDPEGLLLEGTVRLPFNARVGKRKLKPGAYRATIIAADEAGNRSAPRRARFRVPAPRPRRR